MQLSVLDCRPPGLAGDLGARQRIQLDATAWIDLAPGFVHGPGELFERLRASTTWHGAQRWMYERLVDVPRLTASLPADGPGDPLLFRLARMLAAHYGVRLPTVSMALYRDGRDSVAFHRDKVARDREEALIAIVSLGGPRPFLLRPFGGGRSMSFGVGPGDLIVMGGTCQRGWEHAVPKVRHSSPRISVVFRDFVDEPQG